jgi:integrase
MFVQKWNLYVDRRVLPPTQKHPGGRVRYYLFGVLDGTRISLGAFDRRKDAIARKVLLEGQLATGTYGNQRESPGTLTEVHSIWQVSKFKSLSDAAAHAYSVSFRLYIIPPLGDMPIESITPMNVQKFVDGLHLRGLSPGYTRTVFAHLRAFFNDLVNLEILDRSPCRGIILPRVQHVQQLKLEPSEIWRLLDILDFPMRALIAVLAFGGLRIGECLALRWGNIDFQRAIIRVIEAWDTNMRTFHPPKTATSVRSVNMIRQLARILSKYKSLQDKVGPQDLLFPSRDDPTRPLAYGTVHGLFTKARDAAGLPPVILHSLRKSYTSIMLAGGASVNTVSRNLGHSSPAITWKIYALEIQENLQESLGGAEELFGEPESGEGCDE